MKKIFFISLIVFSILLSACTQNVSGSKAAENFPEKPIEIIVPYNPGGLTDTVARILAEQTQKHLPNEQTIMVVNKPGGATVMGTTDVLNAKPDGYTLGYTSVSTFTLLPHQDVTTFDDESAHWIARAITNPFVLAVRADAPWNSFEEWLEYVEANPNSFTYSVAAAGGQAQLSMEALNNAANIQTKVVPFDSGAEQITALLGEHVDGAVLQGSEVYPYIESNEMKVLINFGSTKTKGIEDVPLLTELGYDVTMDLSSGVFAPKGIPEEHLKILEESFKKALEDPETIAKLNEINLAPSYASPSEFQKEISSTSSVLKSVLDSLDN